MSYQLTELNDGSAPVRVKDPSLPHVVLSNLAKGGWQSKAQHSFSFKYVAAGVEVYRYRDRHYPVSAGQFLVVPSGMEGEVEIRQGGDAALGLCLLLPSQSNQSKASLDAPLLFPSRCSTIGRTLEHAHSNLMSSPQLRREACRKLLENMNVEVELLLEDALCQLDGLAAMRPGPRYYLMSRLNIARSYLHEVTDRAVPLEELARVSGTSKFHLLRNFKACFGAPPGTYHRRLRLLRAKSAVDERNTDCTTAAQQFGFADGSSFAHAYRRTFGVAPLRSSQIAVDTL